MTLLNETIIVLGATGRQGGATARHLLAKGWRVKALTRDPNKPAARALQQAGAEIIQSDSEDRDSLEAAMQGAYGVFSVQGYEQEARQGKNVADAARQASIQHFIYSSMQSAEGQARAGSSAAMSKWEIEQYIEASDLPATILRPATFMEDVIGPSFGVSNGTFAIAIKPDGMMRLIAVDDIGVFAALAFERPDVYLGRMIEIAGDMLTPPQIAAAISRATGRMILTSRSRLRPSVSKVRRLLVCSDMRMRQSTIWIFLRYASSTLI
ncbi:NmrA/HSCARG family protein [Ktedonospora formicarum]|uniref:NmrA-like domain-containing protein n=1 Tax=Ktedonospora formicarum TaxID=2778364 RepID=A0A8J3I0K1_9CHLR|nr:NmrA/HSCARG family protein [Ktedonospora formicarum]GHO47747.1 hypothetical protein KSX_59100 [Ktedonospora formicarum]